MSKSVSKMSAWRRHIAFAMWPQTCDLILKWDNLDILISFCAQIVEDEAVTRCLLRLQGGFRATFFYIAVLDLMFFRPWVIWKTCPGVFRETTGALALPVHLSDWADGKLDSSGDNTDQKQCFKAAFKRKFLNDLCWNNSLISTSTGLYLTSDTWVWYCV